jgi:hypothetical protein
MYKPKLFSVALRQLSSSQAGIELRRLGWQGWATLTGPARADILGHSGQRKDGKDGSSTPKCA